MIEGLNPRDEELITNMVTELKRCTAEERMSILRRTLLFMTTGSDWTADKMFVGALREFIARFKGD